MKKLKLKPSAKDSRRYFTSTASSEQIEKAILEYLGILGSAKAAYLTVQDERILNKTIGSCKRESLNDVRAALTLCKIKIDKVSNTIKGLTR